MVYIEISRKYTLEVKKNSLSDFSTGVTFLTSIATLLIWYGQCMLK